MNEKWYVWKNSYGTLSVDNTEHGHYASDCVGTFPTREDAEKFCMDSIDADCIARHIEAIDAEAYGEQQHADDMDQQAMYSDLRRGW